MGSDVSKGGRVVLVTGASSGIGKATAELLHDRGYRVFGTSREAVKAGRSGFRMLRLDVDSDVSVISCVSGLIKAEGGIDVLVNNAGYLADGALEEATLAEAKSQFETNFFGAVRMVDAVLPAMRRRGSGQIINVSSLAGTMPAPFQSFYGPTKAALVSYSEALRMEVRGLGIRVSVLEPGFFRTGLFRGRAKRGKDIANYTEEKRRTQAVLNKHMKGGGDPVVAARAILGIIESRSPPLHCYVGGEGAYLVVKKLLPQGAFESALRRHWMLDG